MSTLSNLKLALDGARTAYSSVADYRDKKAADTYDALQKAADTYVPKVEELYDDSVAKAGNVTKAARVRFEKARDLAEEKGSELAASGQKLSKKARRKAAKAEVKATRKAHKRGLSTFSKLSIATVVVSGIAGAAYVLFNRKPVPGTEPPRVEEQGERESKLVYSTKTGEPTPEAPEDLDEHVVEENPSDDSALTEVEKIGEDVQAEFDAKNAPQRDQSE